MSEAAGKPSGQRRTAEARRARIISAARTLFARQGFHSTGMAQIARESEVLVGQIYRDFASKEDLIAALIEQDIATLLDDPAITGALETGRTDELRDWIRGFVTRPLDLDTRSFLAAVLAEAARNHRIAGILSEASDHLRHSISQVLAPWAPGDAATVAREELADFILTIAGSSQYYQLFGLEPDPKTNARLVALVEAEIANFQARFAKMKLSSGGMTF